MASDSDFRGWMKLLKSKNTEKLLEGIGHCNDFTFISSGGGPSKFIASEPFVLIRFSYTLHNWFTLCRQGWPP